MGKPRQGYIQTSEAVRIELSYLIAKKFIQKGHTLQSSLTWTNDSSISIITRYTEEEAWIRLTYSNINVESGEKAYHDYKIQLARVKSNLGKGEVLYFICPQNGSLCRILYKSYGSPIWKSRTAYQVRIYYETQISSKREIFNNRYWTLSKQLDKLKAKRKTTTYQGKKTKRAERMERLDFHVWRFDKIRWSKLAMPKSLWRSLENFT